MDKQTGPKGFLVVLPSEIIEIPQDSDKSWLTLFYSLPRELAEKWKPAYELPRCPYEVLRTDKYDHIVCDDMAAGHLREKSGYYYAVLNYTDSLGKRKTKWISTGLTVKGNKKTRRSDPDGRTTQFQSRRAEGHERRHSVRGLYGKVARHHQKLGCSPDIRFILDYG